jgi:hypothetical protein
MTRHVHHYGGKYIRCDMTCKLQGWEIHGEINTVKYLIPQPKIPSIRILKDHVVLLSRLPFFSVLKQEKLTVTTPFYPVGTMEILTPWRRSLTLRLLLSYKYMERLFLMFLDHTQRRTTVGRTRLDEWSARRKDLYLTTHDTHKRQISMPTVGFEHTISAGERPQAAHLSVVSVMCCQVEVYATSWSLVQRSPTDCGASLCVI